LEVIGIIMVDLTHDSAAPRFIAEALEPDMIA
jgi:hypothetical protein